jgi:malonyl-CoA O-methyltransferase
LGRDVARRLFDRLRYTRLAPRRILDAGSGTGEDVRLLREQYPQAEVVAADLAVAALARGVPSRWQRQWERLSGRRPPLAVAMDLTKMGFADASFDLVWSSLVLPWTDRAQVFAEIWRVLAPGGLLAFSTYGPDTLRELRSAFSTVDTYRHVFEFTDMHDLGDGLVAAGFAAPVMDIDWVTLAYPRLSILTDDLRRSGQAFAGVGGRPGLTGKGVWRRLTAAYEVDRREDGLPATVELVFGHAWKPRHSGGELKPIHIQRR